MTQETKGYALKLYNRELMSFNLSYDRFANLKVEVTDCDLSTKKLWPMGMSPESLENDIASWAKSRTIPKNRKFVAEILATAGLSANDSIGILDTCKGLSVNDSYWLDDGHEDLSFDDVNLFDNDLDEALSIVAYTGYSSGIKHKLGLSTEWTTNGQYPKAWRRIDNELVLYKAGSTGFMNSGMEPYSEYFASQIAERMGIKHVSYNLEMWKGKLASTCPLINTKDVSYVPFAYTTKGHMFPASMAVAHAFSRDMMDDYRDMLLFDALICNPDRHAKNFGVLRDNKTGNVLGMAPLFDHNLSLFPYDMADEFDKFEDRANTVYYPRLSNLPFIEQVGLTMSEKNHDMLRRMIGFKLENNPSYPVPQDRLDALNRYLEKRTVELLKVPVVDEQELNAMLSESCRQITEPIALLSCKSDCRFNDLKELVGDGEEPKRIVRGDGFGRE